MADEKEKKPLGDSIRDLINPALDDPRRVALQAKHLDAIFERLAVQLPAILERDFSNFFNHVARASRDNPEVKNPIIIDALTERGAQVVGVGRDGDEALALCAQHRPDVLSLDLAMPGKDGIGVLRELRRIGSPVAVVVVSAFSPAHGARASPAK